MSRASSSSGTEPCSAEIAKMVAPAVMWLITSRTVQSAHGEGRPSSSGDTWFTMSTVWSITFCSSATLLMGPPGRRCRHLFAAGGAGGSPGRERGPEGGTAALPDERGHCAGGQHGAVRHLARTEVGPLALDRGVE